MRPARNESSNCSFRRDDGVGLRSVVPRHWPPLHRRGAQLPPHTRSELRFSPIRYWKVTSMDNQGRGQLGTNALPNLQSDTTNRLRNSTSVASAIPRPPRI